MLAPRQSPDDAEDGEATVQRSRLVRTLTFWLRPAFALRVVSRFQRIIGFDRALALASSAFTTMLPVALLLASVLNKLGHQDVADRIVQRYGLSGGGADAVRSLFSFPEGPGLSLGLFGAIFLIVSALSFARAAQRLYEQTWELTPLSVRNSLNGLLWLLAVVVYVVAVGWLHALLGGGRLQLAATALQVPLTAALLVWGGRVLTARRCPWPDLVPFGIIGALLSALYALGSAVYLPRVFSTYGSRYGALGAVFAMITALFGAMLTFVGSAALGREVHDELGRIARREVPPDDEIRQEWATIRAQTLAHWQTAREDLARRRQARAAKHGAGPKRGSGHGQG
jgi:membrane protein